MRLTGERLEQFFALAEEGLHAAEIARRLGYPSCQEVRNACHRYKIVLKSGRRLAGAKPGTVNNPRGGEDPGKFTAKRLQEGRAK